MKSNRMVPSGTEGIHGAEFFLHSSSAELHSLPVTAVSLTGRSIPPWELEHNGQGTG